MESKLEQRFASRELNDKSRGATRPDVARDVRANKPFCVDHKARITPPVKRSLNG